MKMTVKKQGTFIQRFRDLGVHNIAFYLFLLGVCNVLMFRHLASCGIAASSVFTQFGFDPPAVFETQLCLIALAAYVVLCIYAFRKVERKESV